MADYGQTRKTVMSYIPPTTYTEGAPVLDPVQVPVRQTQVQVPVRYTDNPAAVYDLNHLVGYPSNVPHVVHGTPVNVGNYRFLGGRGMTADLYNQVAVDTLNALRMLGGGVSTTAPRSGGTGKTPTAPTTKTVPSAETKHTPQTLSNEVRGIFNPSNFISPVYDTVPAFEPQKINPYGTMPTFEPQKINPIGLDTTGQFLSKVFTELDARNDNKTLADILTSVVNDPNSRTAVANTPNAIPFTVPIPVRETIPVTETLPIAEPLPVVKPLPTTENKMLAPVQFTPNLLRDLLNIEAARQFLPVQ